MVAVSTPPPASAAASVEVGWHVLNTNDAAQARATYGEILGWDVDRGAHGALHEFAWEAGGPIAG